MSVYLPERRGGGGERLRYLTACTRLSSSLPLRLARPRLQALRTRWAVAGPARRTRNELKGLGLNWNSDGSWDLQGCRLTTAPLADGRREGAEHRGVRYERPQGPRKGMGVDIST
jgi:hypothetical protein